MCLPKHSTHRVSARASCPLAHVVLSAIGNVPPLAEQRQADAIEPVPTTFPVELRENLTFSDRPLKTRDMDNERKGQPAERQVEKGENA